MKQAAAPEFGLSTRAIHSAEGDTSFNLVCPIAPPNYTSTTYLQPGEYIYGRIASPNVVLAEKTLAQMSTGAPEPLYVSVYCSGMAAIQAVLYHCQPQVIYYLCGYYQSRRAINAYCERSHGWAVCHDMTSNWSGTSNIPDGDVSNNTLVWIEFPMNETGFLISQRLPRVYAQLFSGDRKFKVAVDNTMAPYPLQDVMRDLAPEYLVCSLTKFHGGHADVQGGMVATLNHNDSIVLKEQRTLLGTVMQSHDAWMLVRSLMTFDLRLTKQRDSVQVVVAYLTQSLDRRLYTDFPPYIEHFDSIIRQVLHPLVQDPACKVISPVFSLIFKSRKMARQFSQCGMLQNDRANNTSNTLTGGETRLKIFKTATSFGGVHSLIDYRAQYDNKKQQSTQSGQGMDDSEDQCLIRVSIGCEDAKDLCWDLYQCLSSLLL
ncbi:hypothetical protein MIR68_008061 [Amoeboaphelidium protococcarum]|nr:hypothetical protein MIR68_008061 [Amoeboaphelidium protococcarum]